MASTSRNVADVEVGEPLLEKPNRISESSNTSAQQPLCPSCAYRQANKRPTWRTKTFWATYLNILLFLTSITLLIKSRSLFLSSPLSPREALQATSNYSPILDAVDLSPITTKIDGRLHVPANASIYRGEPSPATDAAWDDISAEAAEVILVDSATLSRAGFDPSQYFSAPESWGHGSDQYPVQIDVFHQLHCLNAIRKQMYFGHYYAADFPDGKPDEMHWMHQRHCLHMVMQSLTCNANVDIVPHRWVERDEVPFAQFGIERKCRNFEALREWNRENALKDVRKVWPHDKKKMPANAFVWPGYGE
jgi:hypothetical protein